MKAKALTSLIAIVCIGIVSICGMAWAMDEAVLTPTNDSVKSAEEETFNSAMSVWYSHRYADGEKLLGEFAKKHRIAHGGGDPGVAYEYNFAYDDAGNRTQWQIVGGTTTNYTYDAANKMLTAGNSTFTYDDKGNTLTETNGSIVTNYTWNYLNRMTQWQKTGETTQDYVHNANGMRVRVTPSGGTGTNFLIDGTQIAEEITGQSVTSYIGKHWSLIAKICDGSRRVFHADGVGSTRAMTDGNQAITEASVYNAYGNELLILGDESRFGFGGQPRYLNDATGLLYLKARYYDPVLARFISRDPIGYQGGLNLYVYASDDPVDRVDPTGNGDAWWPFNSRLCNDSTDQCMIARGRGGKDRLLKPGECTSWFFDDGDFGWWNGDWFKCSGGHICSIDDRPPDDYAGKPGYLPPLAPKDPNRPTIPPSPSMCKAYCDCQEQSKYNGSFKDSCDCEKKCAGK